MFFFLWLLLLPLQIGQQIISIAHHNVFDDEKECAQRKTATSLRVGVGVRKKQHGHSQKIFREENGTKQKKDAVVVVVRSEGVVEDGSDWNTLEHRLVSTNGASHPLPHGAQSKLAKSDESILCQSAQTIRKPRGTVTNGEYGSN